MIPAMAAKSIFLRLWRSRLGLAMVVAILALVAVGGLSWQIHGLKKQLRAEIVAGATTEIERARLAAETQSLKAAVAHQNERIRALAREAHAATDRARESALAATLPQETWTAAETAPAGHEEMNRWFGALLQP